MSDTTTSTPTTFACSTPHCPRCGEADRMWNIDKRSTAGKLVILCGPCGHKARTEHSLRVYRLSETLRRDALRNAELADQSSFFKTFPKVKEANGNGRVPNRDPLLSFPRKMG